MPFVLFVLFVIIPIAEIAIFIQVGSLIGLGWTLSGILLTAIIGAFLVRQQGFKVLNDARENLQSNKSPIEQVIHGVFILAAGLLLLTPGFLTDTIGFLFLMPPVRLVIARSVWGWLQANADISVNSAHFHSETYSGPGNEHGGTTIDAEAVEIKPTNRKPPQIGD